MDDSENQSPKPVDTESPIDPPTLPDAEKPVSEMTPEEQMAAFEKALKEEDWGHQPC